MRNLSTMAFLVPFLLKAAEFDANGGPGRAHLDILIPYVLAIVVYVLVVWLWDGP